MNQAVVEEEIKLDKYAITIQKAYKYFKIKKNFQEATVEKMRKNHEIKLKELEELKIVQDIENKKIKNVSNFSSFEPFFTLLSIFVYPLSCILSFLFYYLM